MKNRFPSAQYLIVLFPIIAIMSNEVLLKVRGRKLYFSTIAVTLLMTIGFLSILLLYDSNDHSRLVFKRILSSTSKDDAIFVSPPNNPIYRMDSSYFWYNATLIGDAARMMNDDNCRIALEKENSRWRKRPAKLVYFNNTDDKFAPYRWKYLKKEHKRTDMKNLYKLIRNDGFAP